MHTIAPSQDLVDHITRTMYFTHKLCETLCPHSYKRKMSRTPLLFAPLCYSVASLFHSSGEIECGRDQRDVSRRSPLVDHQADWTIYVRETLHSVAETTSGGHSADIGLTREIHSPFARRGYFLSAQSNVVGVLQKILFRMSFGAIITALFNILQTF